MTNRHRVTVLVLPGVLALEFGAVTRIFSTDPHYALTLCAESGPGPVPGSGFAVTVAAGLEALDDADTVIIPGYDDIDATPAPRTLRALRGGSHPRRPARLHLHRSLRPHRGRTARRAPGHHALAAG
ncbi:hypothetical protein OG585_53390 (plasmid) [Streptomyces sp. NBC_01340]|uniref:hypothetical protein n=1 Tax=Streptomyces sp. NBC_01340 TaxID=2903830 RepID=UPI002E15D856|nr:hypothetical protein OG585_53390 [Streptomyces sp. NBC_01340]